MVFLKKKKKKKKMVFFPFQNNPIYLDLSYKTDLDIWDCFRRENQSQSRTSLD